MDTQHIRPTSPVSLWMWFVAKIAGVDLKTLRLFCPPQDHETVQAVFGIMLCVWLYQTALFSGIAHLLFAAPNQFRPELVVGSAFIATFIMLIDSYTVMRAGWHVSGLQELKRGGAENLSGGLLTRLKAGFFLLIRVFLSACIAQLTAIFVGVLIFNADISPRLRQAYIQANEHPLIEATTLVDREIQRASDAVIEESQRNTALSTQIATLRQNEIDPTTNDAQMQQAQQELSQLVTQKAKADEDVRAAQIFASNELGGVKNAPGNTGRVGYGLRYKAAMVEVANAKVRADEAQVALNDVRNRLGALHQQLAITNESVKQQAHDQLPAFESALDAENLKLASLKDQLAHLTAGRDKAIREAVVNAPDYVPVNQGLLAQVGALEQIAHDDRKVAIVILLVDLTSFGFELAAVLAKVMSYVPTTYAALIARDAFMNSVRIVDTMTKELNEGANENAEADPYSEEAPANDNDPTGDTSLASTLFGAPNGFSPEGPKRPRGRPPKPPLN